MYSFGGPSEVPVMTKTFSATLVATELLLLEMLGSRAGHEEGRRILAAADAAEAAIAAAEPLVEDIAATLVDARTCSSRAAGSATRPPSRPRSS